jgi:hypothetical protein
LIAPLASLAMPNGSLALAAIFAGKPPTLSSLADEKHAGSLLRSTAARDPDLRAELVEAATVKTVRLPFNELKAQHHMRA